MSTYDDDSDLGFFDEPETVEAPRRPRRRVRPGGGGPRRPSTPPPGAVALARLAGLVALAIAVVVGLVFWVGSCQGQSRHDEYASYMENVRPIAQSSAQTGTAFTNALGLPNLTLAGLQTKLEQWSRQEQQNYDTAVRLRPPGPLQAAHQEVLSTLQLRAIGFAALANALAGSAAKSSTEVADSFAQQAQLLTASDVVWANLFHVPATETLKRLGVTGVIAPPSQIVANPEVISPQSLGLVFGRLKSTGSGGSAGGLHGSALVGTEAVSGSTTKPLSTSTPTTVDVSANLVFKVTLQNSGTVQSVKVPVTLRVIVSGRSVVTKTEEVASIAPQHQATVSFANLNLPTSAFGATASVHVNIATVQGETQLDNNHAAYPVFFSLSSGG